MVAPGDADMSVHRDRTEERCTRMGTDEDGNPVLASDACPAYCDTNFAGNASPEYGAKPSLTSLYYGHLLGFCENDPDWCFIHIKGNEQRFKLFKLSRATRLAGMVCQHTMRVEKSASQHASRRKSKLASTRRIRVPMNRTSEGGVEAIVANIT